MEQLRNKMLFSNKKVQTTNAQEKVINLKNSAWEGIRYKMVHMILFVWNSRIGYTHKNQIHICLGIRVKWLTGGGKRKLFGIMKMLKSCGGAYTNIYTNTYICQNLLTWKLKISAFIL